jgi:adenylosuccinate synthase
LVEELWLYTQNKTFLTKKTQKVLDFADIINVKKLFGKLEEVNDILEEKIIIKESTNIEKSIEKEIDQNKKKSKYLFM